MDETANRDQLAVRAFLEAFRNADLAAMEALLAPDFVLRQADGLPYAGVYRGVEGWRGLLHKFGQTWSSLVPALVASVGSGPQFALLFDLAFTSRASGKTLNTRVLEFWTLRNGKVVEILPFYWDTAAVAAIAA